MTNECSLPSTWHWPGLVQLPASAAEDQKVVCVPARARRQRPVSISDGHTQAKSYRSARSHRQKGFQPHSWALLCMLKQAVSSPSSSGFPHRACWFDSKPVNQRPRRERQLFFICRCHVSHSEAPLSLPEVAGKTQMPELSEEHRRKKIPALRLLSVQHCWILISTRQTQEQDKKINSCFVVKVQNK